MKDIFSTFKLFLVGSILLFGFQLSSQSILTISGTVAFDDGSPAVEAGLIFSSIDENYNDYTTTDANGSYSFTIQLSPEIDELCFVVLLINCDGNFIEYNDCYSLNTTDFLHDFTFCEYGATSCFSFILPTPSDSEGLINLDVINFGIGPYTYQWDDNSTLATNTISIDFEGDVCVTVTDAQECEYSTCVFFDPIDPCFVYITEEYGYNVIELEAIGFGQSEDISYSWNTDEEGPSIEVTVSGEYCVTITDAFGCSEYDCISVEVDSSLFSECYAFIFENNSSGFIDELSVISYGVAPYIYSWTFNNNEISNAESIEVSLDGEYCVTIIDSAVCTFNACYQYENEDACSVEINCNSGGAIGELSATGYGVEPIIYNWSTGESGVSIFIGNPGVYCVTMTDANGCTAETCCVIEDGTSDSCDGEILTENAEGITAILSVVVTGVDVSEVSSIIWSTGDTLGQIEVTEEGLYCAFVTLEDGCVFEVCTYYLQDEYYLDNGIVIIYQNPNSQVGESAIVELYRQEEGLFYFYSEVPQVTVLGIDGVFYLDNIDDGTYIVRAKPEQSENYIPSYVNTSPFWDESETIVIVEGGNGIVNVVRIDAIEIIPSQGVGAIYGNTWDYEIGDNIMLFQGSTPVGQSYTDVSGNFMFESLAYGTYTVVWERPGLEREEVVVTLSEYNPEIYDLFFGEIVATVDKVSLDNISVFPNPSNGIFRVNSSVLFESSILITITDINGKLVKEFGADISEKKEFSINLEDVEDGLYIMSLKYKDSVHTRKLIKI